MDNKSVKEKIYRYRRSLGYTQEQMAEYLGLSVTQFRSIENGSTKLIHNSVGKIAEALGVSLGELFSESLFSEKGCLEEPPALYHATNADQNPQKVRKMWEEYENKLQSLRKENQSLKALVESKERDISHLETIILMLRRLNGLD